MVNFHDPSVVLKDYIALIKLNHALAGIYIWETVFTAGFELDVLRRKRPYRWTIWLYLGTRYTGLLAFIFFFVNADGPRLPCEPFITVHFALPYACWAFASLIIVIRVIAIWSLNLFVSLLAVGVWSGGLALNVRNLTMIEAFYDTTLETCIVQDTHKGLVNAVGVLVVDVVLLMTMLIGLLRCAHKSPNGIWKLLYQHCIIWIVLALITEIPTVVFLILNLNDAWNEMLNGAAIAIISIGAARMYRSLSINGSLTEYPLTSDLPKFSAPSSNTSASARTRNVHESIQLATIARSERHPTMYGAPVYVTADYAQVEFAPSVSNTTLVPESASSEATSSRHETI